jgi:DNA topoisomerase-1
VSEQTRNAADDAAEAAADAGLRYVTDDRPGIARRRRGRGFSYVAATGETITDTATRNRIARLAVPPAWTDVWICADPRGHVQATGRDARGRKQYRYHERWRQVRDADKYDKLQQFGRLLPDLRSTVDRDLGRAGLPRQKALALVVRLLDDTMIRVGNDEYALANGSYGLTTMGPEHVDVDGATVAFAFVGKGGQRHEVSVQDRRLARLVRRCSELGGQTLFGYVDADGELVDLGSSDVNEYLRAAADGLDVTAKDFRTWGGTCTVAGELATAGQPGTERETEATILAAIDTAAAVLGNTRTVCRSCYVHPAVLDSYRDGQLDDEWRRARATKRLDRAERAVLGILEQRT